MLREVAHFIRYAPAVARMSRRMGQAELYDELMARAEAAGLAERRVALVEGLAGRSVLEIGCGTGGMFPHYPEGARVTAIEPEPEFLRRAGEPARRSRAAVALQAARAEALPFADAAFDAAVVASVLCSVSSVDRALAEIRRVLRPGGELRLMEHVLSERAIPAALMRAANPLWRLWNRQGCNMDRRVEGPLHAAGFTIVVRERFQIFAPGLPAFPSVAIRAVRE